MVVFHLQMMMTMKKIGKNYNDNKIIVNGDDLILDFFLLITTTTTTTTTKDGLFIKRIFFCVTSFFWNGHHMLLFTRMNSFECHCLLFFVVVVVVVNQNRADFFPLFFPVPNYRWTKKNKTFVIVFFPIDSIWFKMLLWFYYVCLFACL